MATGSKGQVGGRPREWELCELGQRIERRLEKLRMSVDELAEVTGVHRQTIYDMMSGETKEPRNSTLRSVASGLGTTREELAGDLF
jgi:transcriptional regulator with XRE-family HTH domain